MVPAAPSSAGAAVTDLDFDLSAVVRVRRAARPGGAPRPIGRDALAVRLAETQASVRPAGRPFCVLAFRRAGGTEAPPLDLPELTAHPPALGAAVVAVDVGQADPEHLSTPASPAPEQRGRFATAVAAGAAAVKSLAGRIRLVVPRVAESLVLERFAEALVALLAPAPGAAVMRHCDSESLDGWKSRTVELEAVVFAADAVPDRIAALAGLCPPELAAIAGAIVEAQRHALTVVIDGVAAAASALVAREIDASSGEGLLALAGTHPAHAVALRALSLTPCDSPERGDDDRLTGFLAALDEAAAALAGEVAGP